MTEYIDLSEIDKKYKDKCSLIKAGKCKNVNIFLQQSRENAELKEKIKKYAAINEQETKDYAELKVENERLNKCMMETLHHEGNALREAIKYKQTLQEIKELLNQAMDVKSNVYNHFSKVEQALEMITKAEEE